MGQIPPSQPDGPVEIVVDKAHVLGFAADRVVTILRLPQGDFVEVVGDSAGDDSLVLPEGGALMQVELTRPYCLAAYAHENVLLVR